MAFEYELPDVGEGVAEGEIVAWHVAVGDHVAEDEVLADVETDKAIVDLPSPVAGTVKELHAAEGDVVAVGSVVVTIDTDDAPAEESAAAEESDDTAAAEGTTGQAVAGGRVFAPPNVRRLARELGVDIATVEGSGPSGRITEGDVRSVADTGESDQDRNDDAAERAESERRSAVKKRTDTESGERKSAVGKRTDTEAEEPESAVRKRTESATAATSETADDGPESADRDRTAAVPATRKLAREHGVDIDEVPTERSRDGEAFVGPEEIEAYVESQGAERTAADPAERESSTAPAEREASAPAGREETTPSERRPVRREPYQGIRRTIGTQMQTSSSTIPHATHHDTAVVDELVETREKLDRRVSEVSLTYLPFVLKAVVAGLQEHPVLNTELDEEEEEIRYKEYYNIGIAVATDAGLMVPVVEDVDRKGLVELAEEVGELVERARSREISREEMQGGTFTVTNFGAIGGEYATPIINQPETAILGIGELDRRPVVDGPADDPAVVPAHTLGLSLSIDHRVIDGAEAARFTNTVIEHLEEPSLLLLG